MSAKSYEHLRDKSVTRGKEYNSRTNVSRTFKKETNRRTEQKQREEYKSPSAPTTTLKERLPFAPRIRQSPNHEIDEILLKDTAIQRYFRNIKSKKRNNGFLSVCTKRNSFLAVRHFLEYLNIPFSENALSSLIDKYRSSTQEEKDLFLDNFQEFSNGTETMSIKATRAYATYIKGIFKANRTRLEVFVDNHFSTKTQRITEGTLKAAFNLLDEQAQLLILLLIYTGARIQEASTTPFSQWSLEEDHWIITVEAQQTKTRIPHILILPKGIGDRLIELSKLDERTCPFPNYKSLSNEISKYIRMRMNIRLNAHYFRKRFATIAAQTEMPPNDWDYLMGSKMSIGHEADIYQLEDHTQIISEYKEFLEPLLTIGNSNYPKPAQQKEPALETSELIKSLQKTIQFQSDLINSLSQQLRAIQPQHPIEQTSDLVSP
jgi:integrase